MAHLEDFARTLRAAAASAYVDALLARRVLLRRQQAFESLAADATANEQRQREGAVAEIVALQARVEARRYRGDVITAEGDARAARFALASQMGLAGAATERLPASVDGELRVPPRTFVDADLIARAPATRPDLRARQRGIRAAQARVDLAHANRGVDVALSLGWLYYTPGQQGSAYQGPPYHSYAQGASRLIELLSAQRTWTDTYIAYETALADHARALIALETAAGTWDLALQKQTCGHDERA